MAGKTKQIGKPFGTRAAKDGALSTAQDASSDSPSAQAFAAKAKDLDALREAVVDAAGVSAGLWLSYLFLFFYLFIAVAAVTHRDFFFENPVKLPFLNVELPLLGFFMLGPLLFLVLHAYVLLHFAMLAGKVGVFHAELQAQIKDEDTRARLRRQLPGNIFVQYLAGPHEVRTGVMGFMLRLIALITLVIFPIALLVFFQLQFLPYHNAPITWWHRIAVFLDILLLWTLWPSIARGQATWISWDDFRRPKIITLLSATLVPLLLVFTIATFPGEWLNSNLPSLRLVPTKFPSLEADQTRIDQSSRSTSHHGLRENKKESQPSLKKRWRNVFDFAKSMEWTSLHDLLVAGDVDLVARKPTSLWSNRLVLPGIDIEALRETVSLRGRRLEGAVLINSRLRKADLTAARLQESVLVRADLREAEFSCEHRKMGKEQQDCAQLQDAELVRAQLDGADLEGANLQRANLNEAQLKGAKLVRAQLQLANLVRAQLDYASLVEAQLESAQLGWARLRRTNLEGANLQDAGLGGAKLEGASLTHAQLQRALLARAELQDANLEGAKLEGATLNEAQLQGATLVGAELRGANLTEAKLQGANFVAAELQGANLARAELRGANLNGAKLQCADLAADFQGANLKYAQLQGADLTYAQLQGADLRGAEVWSASFPADIATQSPGPFGVAELKMSPLTAQDKADLLKKLQAEIIDGELLKRLRDDPILQDHPENWDDEDNWSTYIGQAKEPSPEEIAVFLAGMACEDPERHIAIAMVQRATEFSQDDAKRHYAKPLATALLNEKCKGAKLTDELWTTLEKLRSPPG